MDAHKLTQREFEASLEPGDRVSLHWRQKVTPAIVARVNTKSVSVMLASSVGKYKCGSLVRVNRANSGRWSPGSCVRPE